ncbi:DUF1885 family protein [Ectobacillus antri]|uniref:DUF1885 family protein n=1 Tax=Ectobacillus antri TaxID=2486280 RepID=A0ABT6H0K7_9BACI|nr:DUF1885 family protein [Ectobacillus antri]MDG4655780.1 DUF1885 family protein [Ectobacillus antri]MDG5752455.1 DUF1885 family protein [Ectobacillus antri]
MQHAFVKLVSNSAKQTVSIQDVKDLLYTYQEVTSQTGQQLNWSYEQAAFPYEVVETSASTLHLISKHERYHSIFIGAEQSVIQISLPTNATFGDKGKANEFCRFIAKKWSGELHLFNGRIMYFYKR